MLRIPGMFFEAVPDGGAGGMGGGGAVEPVAPAAVEPVAPVEPAAPVAPAAIDYEDPRFVDMVDARASQIAHQTLQEMVQRAQAQQPQPQPQGVDPSMLTDEYGNLDPVKFAAWADQRDQRIVASMQEMFTPFASQMRDQQMAETISAGEARLEDVLADDIARNGDFIRAAGNAPEQIAAAQEADASARQMVRTIADQMFPEIAQRQGGVWNQRTEQFEFMTPNGGPRAAEMAMSRAADQVRSLLRTAGQSATAVQANQLATLAQQHGEPGGAGTGAGALSRPVVKIGERVVDRYAAAGAPIQ